MGIVGKINQITDELEQHVLNIRRQIHKNPELSFQEYETSALVVKELERMGISYQKSPVKPGLIATIESGKPGKHVMLRADMDALPIQEAVDCPFQSKNKNIMHACGHDVHTANLLAVAEVLKRTIDDWSGIVKLVFQPGEENGGGGRQMIEHGLLESKPDACFALHVMPIERGVFIVGDGYLSAYTDGAAITVHGKSTHSSAPQKGVDALYIATFIIQALYGITSRNISPMENSTLNIGLIQGGNAANIVPDKVEIGIMMRNITPEARTTMIGQIEMICDGIAHSMGGSCKINLRQGYPSVYNHPELSKFAVETIRQNAEELFNGIGDLPENMLKTGYQASLIGEDFGFYAQNVPSCFIQVGTGDYAAAHNEYFQVDESYIKLCTRTMALLTLEYLNQK